MKWSAIFPFRLKNVPVSAWLFVAVLALRLYGLAKLTESQFLLPRPGICSFTMTGRCGFWAGIGPTMPPSMVCRFMLTCWPPFTRSADIIRLCRDFSRPASTPGRRSSSIGLALWFLRLQPRKPPLQGPQWGKSIGLLAAIGWACFQPAQAYSIILMPTAWLVFVFWFVVWQIVRHQDAPALWGLLLLGGLMGFTAMGIATILFLVPLLFAALFLRWKGSFARRIAGAAVIMAGVFLGRVARLDSQLFHRAGPRFPFRAQRRQFLDRQ